jgi:disulfide oxidoreductase YuzD
MKKYAVYPGIKTIYDIPPASLTLEAEKTTLHPHGHWHYSHNAFDYNKFFACENITDPDEWLYPLPMPSFSSAENCTVNASSYFDIPHNIQDLVRQRKCKIVFDCSSEYIDIVGAKTDTQMQQLLNALNISDFNYDIIINTVMRYGFHRDQVIVITSCQKLYQSQYFHMCYLNLHEAVFDLRCTDWNHRAYLDKQTELIKSRSARDKKILSYVGRTLPHKLEFLQQIYENKLCDDNIITCNYLPKGFEYDQYPEDFLNSLPWGGNMEVNDSWDYWWSERVDQDYYDTYASCVMESIDNPDIRLVADKYFNMTEKSINCFIRMRPFIIKTVPHILPHIRSLGYETFGDWIDESYDTVTDLSSRRQAVFKSFSDLSNMSHKELSDMLYEMLPVLEHNHHTYVSNLESGYHLRNFNQLLQSI